MHVVVVGCGRVGSELAGSLEKAGHTVAIIDKVATAFRRLPATFTGQKVVGFGFERDAPVTMQVRDARGGIGLQTFTVHTTFTAPGSITGVVFERDAKSPTGYSPTPRVFADGLAIPLGVLPYKNGCYVQHGHDIVFAEDTDSDGKADKRTVILTGSASAAPRRSRITAGAATIAKQRCGTDPFMMPPPERHREPTATLL